MSGKSKNHTEGGEPKKKLITVISQGAKFKVDPEAMDDMKFVDLLDDYQSGDGLKLPKLLKMILGNQYDEVVEKIANDKGRVSHEKASQLLEDIAVKINPNS